MSQPFTSIDPFLTTIVLATLAIGLPIIFVLAVRFLWDRHLNLGRSKELEKLIWQLHRIASAMEHQMNLSFPAVQPGTEEPHDIAFLQHQTPQPLIAPPNVSRAPIAVPVAAVVSPAPAASQQHQPVAQEPVAPAVAEEQAPLPTLQRREPNVEAPRAGVNSMFGL